MAATWSPTVAATLAAMRPGDSVVWVRMPARGNRPAGKPMQCKPDALGYALSFGYEPCDAPVEAAPVAEIGPVAAPRVAEPIAPVIVNKAKGRRARG